MTSHRYPTRARNPLPSDTDAGSQEHLVISTPNDSSYSANGAISELDRSSPRDPTSHCLVDSPSEGVCRSTGLGHTPLASQKRGERYSIDTTILPGDSAYTVRYKYHRQAARAKSALSRGEVVSKVPISLISESELKDLLASIKRGRGGAIDMTVYPTDSPAEVSYKNRIAGTRAWRARGRTARQADDGLSMKLDTTIRQGDSVNTIRYKYHRQSRRALANRAKGGILPKIPKSDIPQDVLDKLLADHPLRTMDTTVYSTDTPMEAQYKRHVVNFRRLHVKYNRTRPKTGFDKPERHAQASF